MPSGLTCQVCTVLHLVSTVAGRLIALTVGKKQQEMNHLWAKSIISWAVSKSIQAFTVLSSLSASHPSSAKGSDSSPSLRLNPCDSGQQLSTPETPDNIQLQPSHWPPQAYTSIHPPQRNASLLFQTGLFFCVSHSPDSKYIFPLFSPFYFTRSEKKKNEGSDGPHFSSTFLFSLTSVFFLHSPAVLPWPVLVCGLASECFSPTVERQPKVWERWMPESLSSS